MFYKLLYDMDSIDKLLVENKNYIYAESTNMDEIEHLNIKKGFFDKVIFSKYDKIDWPEVIFYYNSSMSERESDFLLNIKRWPIVHKKVVETLCKESFRGIKFYQVKLVDIIKKTVNLNYFVMYIENFIDAFDMNKSKYIYNEKYDVYTFVPQKTYLDLQICNKYDVFRCKYNIAPVYVSELFKNIVEKNQWTGFYFEKQL